MQQKQVTIYTDGSCLRNPGPGGWAAILEYQGRRREIVGGEVHTTNNRMELKAVIEAISALKEPCLVQLWSDSQYVVNAVEKGWARSWKQRGWKKSDKSDALNPDLWDQLLTLLETHDVRFMWVKGHAGHPENERCDELAQLEARKFAQKT